MLIIDDMSKKVEMNSLAQLPLLKKVVLDGLLDKYVIYNADNSQARELGTLF